ncbi:deoxyribose-phosphate aldolase [Pengzhenrongella sicca]|uniref:Deoxyribose-phosphate aldolase n=1 Tax=Pengzhenrongella sicca TaxID=2819238 RepID=A0A8A4ZAG7_9MICO|nr:deoxyribose-phosphate aldolase [Pengzhenrongella sicca]QTE27883.1 deoxyribose-phosphate aldolase [Pengzhenrongella sicca]
MSAHARDLTPLDPTALTRSDVAAIVDHTLLAPQATAAQVAAFVVEAQQLGVGAVCVSPSMLPIAAPGLRVVAVCGFPAGTHHSEIKRAEAARSVADGADEVDMVINLGAVLAGDWAAVEADIADVRSAVPAPHLLKVIIESAVLDDAQIVGACRAAEAAGADFVKTSTGFHPAGGASVEAVTLMAATVGGRLGVKASGAIRTAAAARSMIAAGATRLGLSGSSAILAELDGSAGGPAREAAEPAGY